MEVVSVRGTASEPSRAKYMCWLLSSCVEWRCIDE